jgi:Right handed beta helix region
MRSFATKRRVTLAVAVLAVPAVALGATQAPHAGAGTTAAAAPRLPLATMACGDQITKSVKLAADVTGCAGDGLDITGAHVTLDLNGHLVGGNAGSVGILDQAAGSSVTIQNGRITGFAIGVDIAAAGTKVQNVRVSGNLGALGVLLAAGRDVLTGSVVFSNAGDGVVDSGTRTQITNNTIRDNAGRGIGVGAADPSLLGAVVSGNKVLSNGSDGIFDQTDGVTITGNTVNANDGNGIVTTSDGITVSKNTTSFNTKLGIDASPGGADGGGNHASSNGTAHQCEDIVCS